MLDVINTLNFYISRVKPLRTHLSGEGTEVQRVLPQRVECKKWLELRLTMCQAPGKVLTHVISLIFKINSYKRQGPTLQHRELDIFNILR